MLSICSKYILHIGTVQTFPNLRIPFKNQIIFKGICIIRFSIDIVFFILTFFFVIGNKNKNIIFNSFHTIHNRR